MKLFCLALITALSTVGCGSVPQSSRNPSTAAVDLRQPEGPSGLSEQTGWHGRKFAVATAHPLASAAGVEMLQAGGSAVDAAVAVQLVLTLVEPQSSGIGGGAFLLHHDGQRTVAYDGRETAPAAADETLFSKPDGTVMTFAEAVVGGRAVGVPGTLRLLEMAHGDHGRLPWARLFTPAIRLAEDGFPISRRLHALLAADPHLRQDPQARAYFYDRAGQPLPIGSHLRNPELAAVLRRLAHDGVRAFYEGDMARAMVDKVQQHPNNPGTLSLADLAAYRAIPRSPLCSVYAPKAVEAPRRYRICGFPPPGSGALAIAQILGLLERTPAPTLSFADPQWLHYYSEASRLAFADRAQYLADPDFVMPPAGDWQSLLAPAYLDSRARLIGPQTQGIALAGNPTGEPQTLAAMPEQAEYGTSHFSIIDSHGNALAMTTTIEDAFGARQMVNGYLLNNELTDFSFTASDGHGRPVANRLAPGKRPRSSMSPTLVFDDDSGELLFSGGSPGGAMIIHYTAKLLYALFHWQLTPQQAIDLPNFGSLNGPTLLEENRFAPEFVEALKSRGHQIREINLSSGLQAIDKTARGYRGGADRRREGRVMGE
ncbi:MAG: gamma-glutamyltransferase family protein [Candidatus Accumulibacter sp.]|nr:gamma-glutamyltransferase family protein [Accumulibacter sp.]